MPTFKSFLMEEKLEQFKKKDDKSKIKEIDNNTTAFDLKTPSFLMSVPFNLANDVKNNVWIEELKPEEQKIDLTKAYKQWSDLYNFFAGNSLTYLVPTLRGLQDQVYVANLGICLPHLDTPNFIASNFKSPPRRGEEVAGINFFKLDNMYKVEQCPYYFEGEADLKYMKDNIYIGAHGIRTEKKALDWFTNQYGMNIIPIHMKDDYLYHIDCLIFPINRDTVMACTDVIDKATLKQIEKNFEVVPVDDELAYYGITNSVRIGLSIASHSNIDDLEYSSEHYKPEKRKIETLQKIANKYGLEATLFNISEYTKSGALLSCCVMHCNYADYAYSNV